MQSAPALSPYVATLVAPVEAALLRLLALPSEPGAVTLARAADAPWIATARVRDAAGDFLVDVFEARAARQAWFRTARLAFAYRAAGAGDPFAAPSSATWLRALRDRAASLESGDEAGALLEAVARWLPFSSVSDASYRLALPTPTGTTGVLWLGFRCNQDCDVCWQGRDWPAPPDEVFARWLDELLAAGARCIVLSGGEPTLHPRLVEWVRRAHAAGAHTVLETNAIRLVDDPMRAGLREAGLGEALVSLHAADAARSESITRAPDTFAATVAGIEACLGDGLPVGIQCVVERRNAGALPAHARFVVERFARRHGPLLRRVSYSFPTRYLDGALYRRSIAPLDELRPSLSAAIAELGAAGVEVRFLGASGFPLCAADGTLADARRRVPREVTAGERADRVYAAPCERCAARPRCLGVPPGYLEAHGDRGLRALE